LLLNLHCLLVVAELTTWFFFIFSPARFVSAQHTSSPPFPLSGDASPPLDFTTPPRHVTLHVFKSVSRITLPMDR
jgi:cellulose synthase/poly-beta-1,6-N-acetylglucosamine synthase-like glycosyltransferase